ncbi:MAG: multiheme c-type cytochrome [Fimbriiglobus sp.]
MKVSWLIPAVLAVAAPGLWWAAAADDAHPNGPAAKAAGYIPEPDVRRSCAKCHREPTREDVREGLDKFVLLREYAYWHDLDLHRRAFDALTSPLGKRMSSLLYDGPDAAAAKAECLVCHATDTAPQTPLAKKSAAQFQCDLGVNCQGCHGPADHGVGEHFRGKWRETTPETKRDKFGLVDLRDPEVRASKCISCHVGNASEGKCVTHEMYAAGHPPLPAFELATFSRDEPRHWRSPAAVPYIAGLDPETAKALFHYRPGEIESARLVAVGAITSMKESARLLSFAPSGDARADDGLDFTHFNCAACHHDLRVNQDGISDRQKNGFPGVAGRPVPQTWPVWLARVVLKHADGRHPDAARVTAEFEAKFRALRAAFDARPFGDAPKVRAAGEQVAAACDDVLKLIDGIEYDAASAKALVTEIAAAAAAEGGNDRKDYLDADGAAQLARAYAAIAGDLAGVGTNPLPPPTTPALLEALKPLDSAVSLAARTRYGSGYTDDGKSADADAFLIQSVLAPRLKAYYGYDPAAFRKAFAAVTAPPPAGK